MAMWITYFFVVPTFMVGTTTSYLAAAAIVCPVAARMDRRHAMAAARAHRFVPAVDFHERAVLLMERMLLFGVLPLDGRDRRHQDAARRIVESASLLVRERRHAPQWAYPRREEELIGVRVADSRHERLIAKDVLDLAAVPFEPAEIYFGRERRIKRVRAKIGKRGNIRERVIREIDARSHSRIDEPKIECAIELQGETRVGDLGRRARGKRKTSPKHWVDHK